jgi:CrcB protein
MAFWVVGAGGAATTFSALAVDTVDLIEAGQVMSAVGYVVLSIVGGFAIASGAVRAGARR